MKFGETVWIVYDARKKLIADDCEGRPFIFDNENDALDVADNRIGWEVCEAVILQKSDVN